MCHRKIHNHEKINILVIVFIFKPAEMLQQLLKKKKHDHIMVFEIGREKLKVQKSTVTQVIRKQRNRRYSCVLLLL